MVRGGSGLVKERRDDIDRTRRRRTEAACSIAMMEVAAVPANDHERSEGMRCARSVVDLRICFARNGRRQIDEIVSAREMPLMIDAERRDGRARIWRKPRAEPWSFDRGRHGGPSRGRGLTVTAKDWSRDCALISAEIVAAGSRPRRDG